LPFIHCAKAAPSPGAYGWAGWNALTPEPMSNAANGAVTDGPIAGGIAGALSPERMRLLNLATAEFVSRLAAVLAAKPVAIVPSEPAVPSRLCAK
jgi:hypothetical protein